EPLMLGRAAMGERVRSGALADFWRVRRGGRLLHADALRFGPSPGTLSLGALTAAAGFAGARAAATLLYVAPDAGRRIDAMRALLDGLPSPVMGGASAWDGRLAVRLLAPGGAALRAALLPVIQLLRPGSLPRVWSI
ncbi:MAG: urease accessory protein UreD, partial [Paracoccaceae bacterium]